MGCMVGPYPGGTLSVNKLPGEGLGVALDMACTLAAASSLVSFDPLWTTEDCAITEELVS
jgi:hypothetical protein